MIIIRLGFSPSTPAAQTCSLRLHPWPIIVCEPNQAGGIKIHDQLDPEKEMLLWTSRRCWTPKTSGCSGVRQCLRRVKRTTFHCSACVCTISCHCHLIAKPVSYSGLRIYSKLLSHSVQFGTKHVCRHFCGWDWVERPALLSLLFWSQGFQRVLPIAYLE